MRKYFVTDIYRLFTSVRFYAGILLVMIFLYFPVYENGNSKLSVLNMFLKSVLSQNFMLCYVACAIPFSSAFQEDLETYNIRYAAVRGNLKEYVISNIYTQIISSILVMMFGVILFWLITSIWFPFTDRLTLEEFYVQLNPLYNSKTIMLWVVIWGLKAGVHASLFTLMSSLVSLFITNKMLLMACPLLIYEFLRELEVDLSERDIYIFCENWFRIDRYTGLSDVTVGSYFAISSVVLIVIISQMIFFILKRRL